jgi:site-specific DNA recombinase
MKAIGYIRVSTEEQSQQGVSLFNQEQKIRAYCCIAKDWELTAVIRNEGCLDLFFKMLFLQPGSPLSS